MNVIFFNQLCCATKMFEESQQIQKTINIIEICKGSTAASSFLVIASNIMDPIITERSLCFPFFFWVFSSVQREQPLSRLWSEIHSAFCTLSSFKRVGLHSSPNVCSWRMAKPASSTSCNKDCWHNFTATTSMNTAEMPLLLFRATNGWKIKG